MDSRLRIAITGAGGRLGAALCRIYARGNDVIALGRDRLDLFKDDVRQKLDGHEWDVLVNCAALTNVDYCETNEAEAMRVNAEAAGALAKLCAERKARMIHISTDYVFDGEKPEPYTEEDPANPISVYGRSKREGEIAVLAQNPLHLVARVSWVFGPDRPSFVDQVVQRALQTDDLSAVGDKYSVPAFSLDIAAYLEPFLNDYPEHGGLLHIANSGVTTWREYGEFAVKCAAEMGAPVRGTTLKSLKLEDMRNFVAKRPVHSAMAVSRLTRWTSIVPRHWQDAVRDYLKNYAPVTAPYRQVSGEPE